MEKLKFNLLDPTKGCTKEEYQKMFLLGKRARLLGAYGTAFEISMDIEAARQAYGLKIEKLEKFDDANFAHDIHGIQQRINREGGYFEDDLWLPRSM